MNEKNQALIKALNMYGRVPKIWEPLEEIKRLNNIIFNQNKRNSHQRIANDNLQNKNKELNNIINELEKFIDLALEIYNNVDIKTLMLVKDKIKELKGEDKE